MKHLMLDGFQGYRSRFDDIRLMHELLAELPLKMGAEPIMPPFVLPYYDGVDPEDAGISGMVLLRGGHFTVHTFSYAECYFADFVYGGPSDPGEFRSLLGRALPCSSVETFCVDRSRPERAECRAVPSDDFGPHYTLDLKGYSGPRSLDGIFELLDKMPGVLGMTPIMRPLVLRDRLQDGSDVISGVTMIAESHMALHVFPERGQAAFDLFSCRFFDESKVLPRLHEMLPAVESVEHLAVRGRSFARRRRERASDFRARRSWIDHPWEEAL